MIINPNPLSIGTANGLWLTSVDISRPRVAVTAMPFNGERLAGNPSDAKRIVTMTGNTPAAKALLDIVFAEVARIVSKPVEDVNYLRVSARDPSQPVTAEAGAKGLRPSWKCEDLFALAATDEALAAAIGAVYAFVQEEV